MHDRDLLTCPSCEGKGKDRTGFGPDGDEWKPCLACKGVGKVSRAHLVEWHETRRKTASELCGLLSVLLDKLRSHRAGCTGGFGDSDRHWESIGEEIEYAARCFTEHFYVRDCVSDFPQAGNLGHDDMGERRREQCSELWGEVNNLHERAFLHRRRCTGGNGDELERWDAIVEALAKANYFCCFPFNIDEYDD
jgi:hypothetical protein